ncbi:hypothetical protein IAQ61_000663 [Plenodomus lingam]|uniref:uncharacterized protein n=1 Tax=Leptosphaeria maculans TaxID=5022 RepID=UPI00333297AE|nr:hypothetical protein IAQ61_000663 [Plenodomus lingam]
MPPPTNPLSPIFSPTTELLDLGRERFDQATANPTSRDHALLRGPQHTQPYMLPTGKAPRGLESKVFAWNVFQHTTEERDEREEAKGDLHEGQLHRYNRAARREEERGGMGGGGGGGGGGGFTSAAATRGRERGMPIRTLTNPAPGTNSPRNNSARPLTQAQHPIHATDALCAGRKPDVSAPPLAKGFAEELDRSMFWDGPIV